ncbi:MAG TPA: CoA transferase [Myxococcota bacterium]|nr:CoA transferase [Myxococcota bacterium]
MLERRSARIAGAGAARDYAAHLLTSLGAEVVRAPGAADLPSALEWARSGAMWLTGSADGAPRPAPGPLASCARGALEALRALAPWSDALPADGAALLGERAACFGYARAGRVAPSGSCRLLRCGDGWIALNLARDDDRASLPAWLEQDADPHTDHWAFAERGVAQRSAAELVVRAGWLGLAVAEAAPSPDPTPAWLRWRAVGARSERAWDDPRRAPLVLDLSALWAGPLAGEILAAAGARVVKVESPRRPDGARSGPRDFYDLCNGAKPCVALDLGGARGREQLAALAERADAILESARPRALSQLGLDPETWLAESPGRTWVSITGYGRGDPAPGRVAFGDDAGVAAGLALSTGGDDAPLFCGDAIADPLAGLHAAVAAAASLRAGGGHLLDVALRDVTAHAAAFRTSCVERAVEIPCASPPRARRPTRAARPLGADTASILAELGVPC